MESIKKFLSNRNVVYYGVGLLASVLLLALLVMAMGCGATPNEEWVGNGQRYYVERNEEGAVVRIVDSQEDEQVVSSGKQEELPGIGQAEQPYSGSHTPTYQFGVNRETGLACNKSNASQQCTVPQLSVTSVPGLGTQKVIKYFMDGSISVPADRTTCRNAVETIDTDLTADQWNEVSDINDATFILSKVAVGGSGGTDMAAYAKVFFTNFDSTITEGAGVVGNYLVHAYGVGNVDIADINLIFGATGQYHDRALRRACGYAALIYRGTGGRPGTPLQFMSGTTMSPSVTAGLTTGEVCRTNGYTPTENSQFNLFNANCTVE